MYNSNRLRLILAATSLTLLSACGQSGPLYLPEDAPQNQPVEDDQGQNEQQNQDTQQAQ
ncbi:LPS translocon maturation chaperone LptM [Pseudoalteromonas sp. GB56]